MSACSSQKKTVDEKGAEKFLGEFLFQEGGCFTLLGDKPITSMLIFQGEPKDCCLENLSEEALQTLKFVDYKTAEHFASWKNFSNNLTFDNFFFVELSAPNDPSTTFLFFVNICETKKVFDTHMDLFLAKTEISEWENLLSELKKPNTTLWQALFKDHYLAGLLYGFGQQNAQMFCNKDSQMISEEFTEVASKEHFPIPVYAASENDEMTRKYKNQREAIKKVYQEGSVLEVTLKTLQKVSLK
ncbi:MAG: hypothetical protein V4494_07860 [Chlamydiota bacterium]